MSSFDDISTGPPLPTPSDLASSPPSSSAINHTSLPPPMYSVADIGSRPSLLVTPSDFASSPPRQIVLAPPHPNRKGWFIIKVVSINSRGNKVTRKVLCVVDPRGSVATDATRIEDLLFCVCRKERSKWELPFICLAGPKEELELTTNRKRSFQASIGMLVEHLREFEAAPSSDLEAPDLWGSGDNRLEMHFTRLPRN